MTENTETMTIYLPLELKQRIAELAKEDERSVSNYVNRLLRKAIQEHDNQ